MPRRRLRALPHECGGRPSEADNECWKRALARMVSRRKVDCRDVVELLWKRMATERRLRLGGRGDATHGRGRRFLAFVAVSRGELRGQGELRCTMVEWSVSGWRSRKHDDDLRRLCRKGRATPFLPSRLSNDGSFWSPRRACASIRILAEFLRRHGSSLLNFTFSSAVVERSTPRSL